MSDWPNYNDYTTSIQTPGLCFRDPELRRSSIEKHPLTRMPKIWSGSFAQVYALTDGTSRWAVKCFTRSAADIRQRYAIISAAIASSRLPYFSEFTLLDDEMLVSGRRYPILKMRWVEGQTLDKFVEANLYQPKALLEIASGLIRMVKDLESRGVAHGDLQHRNILIQGTEVKLVDYDGMFVPAFAGARASELGLPSYQHPRRDETLYNTGLDRFPLLVICTGLCAIAGTPSLWYEFGTGDNLLFTKEDFEYPAKSRLFNRLSNLPDAQLAYFTEMLRVACSVNAADVQFPERDISLVTTTARPWWVTTPTLTAPPAISSGAQDRTRTSVGPTAHWSIIVALTFPVAPILLYLGGFIIAQVLACGLLLDALFYGIERYIVFRKLPVFIRRSELARNMEQLKGKLSQGISEQSNLQKEPALLSQREAAEKASVLKELQEKEIDDALSRIDISQLGVIRGIGPSTLYNLRSAGINSALQLRQRSRYGHYGVPGIGASRGSDIHHKLSSWEAAAWQKASKVLPTTAESKIAGEYAARRRELLNKLDSIGRKVNLLRAQISQSEAEQRQLHLPSFRDFLRRNF